MGLLPGRWVTTTVLAALSALALASCGGEDKPSASPDAGRPYPPRATEPARSPELTVEPEGRVSRVGEGPEGVAVDPASRTVAVGLERGALALVDADSGEVRETVRLPSAPRHLSLAASGGPFLVPAEEADTLVQVDPRSGEATETKVGDGPHDAVAAPGGRVVVADELGSTVSIVRGSRLERSFAVDVQPGGVASVGRDLAVVSVRAYTVELFALRGGGGGGSQNVGDGPSHVVASRDGRLFVADTRGGAISVFETRPRLKFVQRVRIGGSPYGLALDGRREVLWVTDPAANRVVEVAVKAGEPARAGAEHPTVRQPNTVGVNERTGQAYVAGRARGLLQTLDP